MLLLTSLQTQLYTYPPTNLSTYLLNLFLAYLHIGLLNYLLCLLAQLFTRDTLSYSATDALRCIKIGRVDNYERLSMNNMSVWQYTMEQTNRMRNILIGDLCGPLSTA